MVLDLSLGPDNGLSVLRTVRTEGIDVPVVVLTMSNSEDDLSAALRAGVRGYLLKDMDPDDVIESIGRAARGELVVAPTMALKLAQMWQSGQKGAVKRDLVDSLTERERQVLDHVARGKSNKVIAQALDISHNTVKLHVRHIMAKLDLGSRVEAAVFAFEHRSRATLRQSTATWRHPRGADHPDVSVRCWPVERRQLLRHLVVGGRKVAVGPGQRVEPVQRAMEFHHVAHNQQAGRREAAARHLGRQVAQRAGEHLLGGQRAVLHSGNRPRGGCTVRHQLAADVGQRVQTHVDHHRLVRAHQRFPVQVGASVLQVAGDEQAALGVVAVRERDAGVARHAAGGGHARDHLEVHAVCREFLHFFAAATEDEGVTAL